MEDYEQSLAGSQAERDKDRQELFLPVGTQVTNVEANDPDEGRSRIVDEIESLCMNCQENGITRLLLTKVPFFREIILMSFYCEHCSFKNTEVQAAGEIQRKGCKYTLRVEQMGDLQRQVVKSDTATIRFEEVDLEIPAARGRMTNIEGILAEVLRDLEMDQGKRKKDHPDLYEKLEVVIEKIMKMMRGGAFPFTITLNDTAGNSSIEPSPIDTASRYTRLEYNRTPEQNAALGLAGSDATDTSGNVVPVAGANAEEPNGEVDPMAGVDILEGHTYTMPCECPGCGKPGAMNLQMVKIPYFKQVVITAVVCPHCDYRTNEVKTGGEIPEQGRRITLEVKTEQDMKRDILKSETCMLAIPECHVEVQPGTMGGRFTTVEGLLTQIRDDLRSSIFDTDDGTDNGGGDSMDPQQKSAWGNFFATLDQAIRTEFEYTVVLEDPLANSYVQSYLAPDPDPQIREEFYDRTQEEEDDLGLSDMRTHRNEDGEYVKEEQTKSESMTTDSEPADTVATTAAPESADAVLAAVAEKNLEISSTKA